VNLKKFNVEMPAFVTWMEYEKNLPENTRMDSIRAMVRVCHMLEIEGKDIQQAGVAEDPALWVAVFVNKVHQKMFTCKLLSTAYTWTRRVNDALKLFVEWLRHCVLEAQLTSDELHHVKWIAALDQYGQALRGGIAKKLKVHEKTHVVLRPWGSEQDVHEGSSRRAKAQ
jgi:hypothetical protein